MIIFLVRAHASFEYQLDEQAQKETWAKQLPQDCKVFWLYGDPTISDSYEQAEKLFVPCVDDMENMLQKVIVAIDYLSTKYSPDLLVLTTTNTYWNLRKTRKLLPIMQKRNYEFSGYFLKWIWGDTEIIRNGDSFVSGASMLLRPSAFDSLKRINLSMYRQVLDDVAISHYLSSNRLAPMPIKRNNLFAHHLFVPRSHSRVKGVVDLQHNRERMRDIDDFYNSKKFPHRLLAYLRLQLRELARIQDFNLSRIPKILKREIGRIRVSKGRK